MRGFYVGALGQFIHANAEFNWDGVQIFDEGIDDFGVGGVAGYGWRLGAFYIGPEVFVNYAELSNNLTNSLIDPDIASLSIDREFSAGVNLLAGVSVFEENVLLYGLVGGGATHVDGRIRLNSIGSLSGDVWYPVLSFGGGLDWKLVNSLSLRLQANSLEIENAATFA